MAITPRKIYLVNTTGTHPLGDTEFAQAIWRAAAGSLESWLADAAIRPAPRALTSTSANRIRDQFEGSLIRGLRFASAVAEGGGSVPAGVGEKAGTRAAPAR